MYDSRQTMSANNPSEVDASDDTKTQHIQLSHKLIAAWNSHDPRKVARFFSPSFIGDDIGIEGKLVGQRDIIRNVLYDFLGFPDLTFEITQVISQDDRFVMDWVCRGTHLGHVMNIPPTGRRIELRGVSIYKVGDDGKIVSGIRVWDMAGMLRQIGLLPDLQHI
jgi:steroid delta-isomerase-like uncharacterized protein